MSQLTTDKKTSRAFLIISIAALVWNLIGVMSYLMSVMISPETLAGMPEAERALYNTPAWVTSAYAIAVFGGTIASIGLLMRKAWAVPVFIVSLAGILIQMGHAFFMSDMLEVHGTGAAILPLLIVAIAVYLVWFARASRKQGKLS